MKYFLVITCSLFIITIGVTSCIDEIEEKEADLGVEASAAQRNEAIEKAFVGIDISQAPLHASVLYENNQRVELGAVLRSSTIEQKLIGIKDYTDATAYIMEQTVKTFDLSTGEELDSKTSENDPLMVAKNPPTAAPMRLSAMVSPFSLMKQMAIQTLGTTCDGVDETDSEGLTYDCVRYFNLKYELRKTAPPPSVRNRENCMGLPNCQMNIRFISFDEVKWRQNRSVKKSHLEVEIAPEVPDIMYYPTSGGWGYIPPVFSLCERGLYTINGQKYMVALCTVLRDFMLP